MSLVSGEHRIRWPTLAEAFVIVAITGTLVAVLSGDSATRTRREIERRIESWQPGLDDRRVPPASVLRPAMDIMGEWLVERRRSSTRLVVSGNPAGEYRVQFKTSGCMGGYNGTRQATFSDGVVHLDKAVSEYTGSTYDRLYAIEHEGVSYLLPAAAVTQQGEAFPQSAVFRQMELPETPTTNP